MITKTIVSKKLPFYMLPVRLLYRKIASKLFKSVRLFQIEKDSIKYLIWANEDIGKRMILQGSYESNELNAFKSLIRNGDVCIDVGGNVGIFSLNFAKCCGEKGHVYVIEPMRKNQLVIELAAGLNNLKNISVFPYAFSDCNGEVILEIPSVDGAYTYIKPVHNINGSEKFTVRCLTLIEFVQEQSIKQIDILKIDVEGAEKLVLDGGKSILSDAIRRPRVIMVELVDEFLGRYGGAVSEVLLIMTEFGYKPYYALGNGELSKFENFHINKIFNVFFILGDS